MGRPRSRSSTRTATPLPSQRCLNDTAKAHEVLVLRGGVLDGIVVGDAEIKQLATLPSADVLRAQLVGALVAPMTTVVGLFTAPLRDLVGVLDARIRQLEEQGEAVPEEAPPEEEQEPQAEAPAEEEAPEPEEQSEEPSAEAEQASAEPEEETSGED